MPTFHNQDLWFSYTDQGDGAPVLLVHGFASNQKVNWFDTGWVEFLLKAGRCVMTFDLRGHGESDKPRDPALYQPELMVEDMRALLDHLKVGRADMMGYSMGARLCACFLLKHPQRVCTAVLAGVGAGLATGLADPAPIIAALEAPSLADVTTPAGRMFRSFAEQTKSDLNALAACMRATRKPIAPQRLKMIKTPVLIATGTRDSIAGSGAELAKLIPGAELLNIVDRDHMRAVGDKQYKHGVLDFWTRHACTDGNGG